MSEWREIRLRFFVTGKGEAIFLKDFFSQLAYFNSGVLIIDTSRDFPQLSVRGSTKRYVSDKYESKKGPLSRVELAAENRIRPWLTMSGNHLAILIDDLESSRRSFASSQYTFYREAIDQQLDGVGNLKDRFSVHFFVNMVEAYFFADHQSVNGVCGTSLDEHPGDVENIRHPKNRLKELVSNLSRGSQFHEVRDGQAIAKKLNLAKVLDNPEHCRALRALVAWIWEAIGQERGEEYQLQNGRYWDVTVSQLRVPPPPSQICPLDAEE